MNNYYIQKLSALVIISLISLVLGAVLAILVYYTMLRETLLNPLADCTFILAIFTGAFWAAKTRGSRGLITGFSVGGLFFVIVFLLTLILEPGSIEVGSFLSNIFLSLVAGSLGGIVGVGMSN